MMAIPYTEIVLFLAFFFAPPEIDRIDITHPRNDSITFIRTDAGWNRSSDDSEWSIDGTALQREDDRFDLKHFVEEVVASGLDAADPLTLPQDIEVKKTDDELLVYPNGQDQPENRYTVTYRRQADAPSGHLEPPAPRPSD